MPYEIYKFEPGDVCYYHDWDDHPTGFKVFACYTTDKYTHVASPHRRYVLTYEYNEKTIIEDLSEGELLSVSEYQSKIKQMGKT